MTKTRLPMPPVPEKFLSRLEGKYGAQRRWYWRNREKTLADRKRWRLENPGYHQEWIKKNPERHAANRRKILLKQYGITGDEYNALLKKQNGRCAFPGCKAKEFRKGRKDFLAVDHCHKTDKIRGLLCYRHNILIGLSRDSIKELKAAIRYIRRKPK